ncbi:MAG: tetratricopeptide repeat protein, partial [Dehalococcoidia bacterium]|nr:tetratricopeptide repeat protein [Dehalococcoidia bacterium]
GKLAATYHRMDQAADADRHFTEAVARFGRRVGRGADDPATKYYIASLYGLRGETEKAVRYLRESLAELPALNRVRARSDPDFDPIRSDPAFTEALATNLHPAA